MDKDRLDKLIAEVEKEKSMVSNYPITKVLCGYILELATLIKEA